MARSAHREAVGYFEQALSALPHLPEQRATHEQAIDLRLALRTALHPSGDLGRILAYLREAEALAAALDDPRRLGQVCCFLSQHFYGRGTLDQAIAAAQRALALAAASGDVVQHALANQYLGMASYAQGDYRWAIDCLRQTVASLEGAQRHERFGQFFLPAVNARVYLAWCHAALGMFPEGSTIGDEGLRIAEAVAHPGSLIWAYYGIGALALRQGDLLRALPLLERAICLCQDVSLPLWVPTIAAALGTAYALSGRVVDALRLLERAVEQCRAQGRAYLETLCSLPLGEAHMLAGHLEEAYTFAERALVLARAHQVRCSEAWALQLLGDIVARCDPPQVELAAAHYRAALTLAEELGMRPLQAHCHRGLGTLYATTGQAEQAQAALSTAIALYRSMDMTFWLPQAEAALAQMA
jgi:tetratricopeptide (TPR) repeat protein